MTRTQAGPEVSVHLVCRFHAVRIEQQVLDFIGSLASESRRALREAPRKLAREKGHVRPLEGFYRVRVNRYRIIFSYHRTFRQRMIRCVFGEHRTLIYEVFAQQLHDLLEP
ncbi:MAG: type II toxin-antitoxin system RelE family toxin [Chthoniobacterales bacterium]